MASSAFAFLDRMMPKRMMAPGAVSPELVALVAAGALFGFGLILYVAANWTEFGKVGRFGIVGAAVVLSAIGTALRWDLRLPSALAGILATGGMLALYGQTYQTGIDPWPLFATWAVLALPWAIAARHDAVWVLIVLIAATALQLWLGSTLASTSGDTAPVLIAWAMAICGSVLLSPWIGLQRWLGHTGWAFRVAALLTVVLISVLSIAAIYEPSLSVFVPVVGVALLVSAIAVFAVASPFYRLLLSASVLGVTVFLIARVWYGLWQLGARDVLSILFLCGLSAAIIASAAGVVMSRILALRGDSVGDATAPLVGAVRTGVAAVRGKLPARPVGDGASWPVAVVSAIGASLAAMPVFAYLAVWLGPSLVRGPGAYIVGVLALVAGVLLVRQDRVFGFRQQFGYIALVVGLGLFGFAFLRDLPMLPATLLGFALFAAVSALTPLRWISLLLGLGAVYWALGIVVAVTLLVTHGQLDVAGPAIARFHVFATGYPILFVSIAVAVLLIASEFMARGPRFDRFGHAVARFDGFVTGFAGGVLLYAMSGSPTFLVSGPVGGGRGTFINALPFDVTPDAGRVLAVVFAVAGIALAVRQTRDEMDPQRFAIAGVVLALIYVMPMLAVPFLIFVAAWLTQRDGLTAMAGISAVWVMGSFYYWLGLPLFAKGLFLMALGLALGAVLWWRSDDVRARLDGAVHVPEVSVSRWPAVGVGISVAALAFLVGSGIVQSERLIAGGRQVFVELGPRDPRSRLQGDYMALNFRMPRLERSRTDSSPMPGWAIADVADNRVATIARFSHQPDAGPDQIAMTVWFRGRTPILGTTGYYFAEGQAKTFEAARYGIFRVGGDGRVILTGLADENLKRLRD